MVYPWGTTRRINAYSDYFRKVFGERIQKLSVNAGFTCPNRDGTLGTGGCTFCDNSAFIPGYNLNCKPVLQQLEEAMTFHKKRYRKVRKYLAYFQAYTNTYATLDELKQIYQPALQHPDVIGIVVGTRPDCVDNEKLNYFASLSEKKFVVIEYGIESVSNKTLHAINRGHTYQTTRQAIIETANKNIRVGGHLIIGLPGESREDWLLSIPLLNKLPLHSIKFHQLQIISGTAMEKKYKEDAGLFQEFELEEYLQLMADLIERLNPNFVIERIAGEVRPGISVKKGWGVRYDKVLERFEEILAERDSWQGKFALEGKC